MDAIAQITARARIVGPRCGALTVIALDGPAGSGKTTLAAGLAAKLGAQTVAMDDLYPGWAGMREGGALVARLLRTLSSGEVATYQRYDWHAGEYRESHEIQPQGTLIVEGVGSVRSEFHELLSLIVLVREPDAAERLRRGIERDGEETRAHWLAWMREEHVLHEEVGLAALADLVIDGMGRVVR